MLKHVLFCYMFAIFHIIYLTASESSQTYGEFILKMRKIDICKGIVLFKLLGKGPKRNDCVKIKINVVNETVLVVDLDVMKDVKLSRGKIVSTMNNKPLVRLQMKNPCDHFFIKYIFRTVYNIYNCKFKKGNYIKNIDIADVANKYYGGMFLYGNMTFKALFYNDECNFSCVDVEVSFIPKNNNKTM